MQYFVNSVNYIETNKRKQAMKTHQITLKTRPGQTFEDLINKVSLYADMIVLTTAFFRNNDQEWQTSITIEVNE